MDGDHVGVGDLGHRPGLAEHAGPGERVGHFLAADQLDRHLAVEAAIVGDVDGPHGALAEALEQDEVAEGRAEGRGLPVGRGAQGRRTERAVQRGVAALALERGDDGEAARAAGEVGLEATAKLGRGVASEKVRDLGFARAIHGVELRG
nr:hypothetical protein [Nannocystis sp.]